MNLELKFEILKRFPSQADFALVLGEHESKISNVIRGRRKLTKEQADRWILILKCRRELFDSTTK